MLKRMVILVVLVGSVLGLALNVFAQDDAGQAFIGIGFEPVDEGVRVTRVLPGGPADEAGLEVGDIVAEIGGEPVTADNLQAMVSDHQPGDALDLAIVRDGESMELSVTLGTRPADNEAFEMQLPEGFEGEMIVYNAGESAWQIMNLSENSALAEAGLQAGDSVTAFNGESYDPTALTEFVAGLGEDETVTLTVERDGETLEIEVPASAISAFGSMMSFGFGRDGRVPFDALPFGMMGGGSRLGVTFVTLDEQIAQENEVEVTEGALIVEVAPESPASDSGLQADDIVTAVNGEVVDVERTLRDRLFAYEPGDTITLSVMRATETMEIEVTLDESQFMGEFMPFFGNGRGPRGEFFEFREPDQPEQPAPAGANI
jgi:S1-C subfamily serine protease